MIERCNQLYQELQNELKYCRSKGYPFLIETEYCFHSAEKFRGLLREQLRSYEFPDIEEEICFFKTIKPKFIAESEYASLLNFAGNFCPDIGHSDELLEFWKRQFNRLTKFTEKHKEFYSYHSTRQTHLDTVYYTRISIDSDEYSFDSTSSGYDLLLGQLLAQQRYSSFAGEQLRTLLQKG
jgi:hypothetical protein